MQARIIKGPTKIDQIMLFGGWERANGRMGVGIPRIHIQEGGVSTVQLAELNDRRRRGDRCSINQPNRMENAISPITRRIEWPKQSNNTTLDSHRDSTEEALPRNLPTYRTG